MDRVVTETVNILNLNIEAASFEVRSKSHKSFPICQDTREWIKLRRKLCNVRDAVKNDLELSTLVRKTLNKCRKKVTECLSRDETNHKDTKADKIAETEDQGKKWKLFNQFVLDNQEQPQLTGLQDVDGTVKLDDVSIANIHGARLETTHQEPTDPLFNEGWKQAVNAEVLRRETEILPTSDPDPYIMEAEPVVPEEIVPLLTKKKDKSAPGMDKVTYKHLKMGGHNLVLHLCTVFTIILAMGYYPDLWKIGVVTMIPKPGKNILLSENHRPITLLSCISKLLEAVILQRFKRALSRAAPENAYQAGYKKNRSCQEHVLCLTEAVLQAFKKLLCVFAVFLDAHAAFDTVWRKGVYFKLLPMKIPAYLKRIIADFLRNRRLIVEVNKSYSREITMQAGTPQGAVLSPEIFNFYTNDLMLAIPQGATPSQFADDVGVWVTNTTKSLAATDLQQALNQISLWCRQWRMKLSPNKSKSMFFSMCPTHLPREEFRFLGVIFDDKLRWTPYLRQIVNSVNLKVHLLRQLAVQQNYKFPKLMVRLFNSLVTPVFDFGSICFLNMAETHWRQVRTFHAKALRSILSIPQHIPYAAICDGHFLKDYPKRIKDSAVARIGGILGSSPFGNELLQAACRSVIHRYKTPIQSFVQSFNQDNDAV